MVVLWPFELVTIVNDDSVVAAEALLVVCKARGMRRVFLACLALVVVLLVCVRVPTSNSRAAHGYAAALAIPSMMCASQLIVCRRHCGLGPGGLGE